MSANLPLLTKCMQPFAPYAQKFKQYGWQRSEMKALGLEPRTNGLKVRLKPFAVVRYYSLYR